MQEFQINQPIKLPFVTTPGKTAFQSTMLLDGVLNLEPITYSEIGNGLYVATFTPVATGVYTFFTEGQIQASFSVVVNTVQKIVRDIQDQALGSWTWDKKTGELTLLRQDASVLATYTISDTLDFASRELVI